MNKDRLLTILTVIMIGLLLVLLQGCKEDTKEEPAPPVVIVEKLPIEGTFTTDHVKLDGVDVTGAFKKMSITFTSEKTFNVVNPVAPIWPPNGSFSYENNEIRRNDGINVSVTSLNDSRMVLELFYTPQSGRATGIKGKYVFELVR
ncbi:MAG TPA: hypothetical protein VFE50_24030 [Cyclobacteriaceae bacterium]|nr:hypothetical protein [Cyclobacteriaceae bacterium]